MNIFFRVDASKYIGTGHVMRCLTLAKALENLSAKCKFICKDNEKNNLIKKNGFEVEVLTNSNNINRKRSFNKATSIYSDSLEESWREDAKQTISILNNDKIDWLVVDHYEIDERWEKKLRPYTNKIMVIDDLANRKHNCDLLLDQNLIDNFKGRYHNLLPKYCGTLLGPQYALLQHQYKNLHLSTPPRTGLPKHILVYFGGTDKKNLAEMTLFAFLKLNRKDIALDIVISSNSGQKEKIIELSKGKNNIKIHTDLTSLANLMLKADMSIGASGTTSWERCCLGLPSLVISIAENQKPIAQELHKKGVICWLGHYDIITTDLIYDALETVIEQDLESWSSVSNLIIDGDGAQKVASVLTLCSDTKFKVRLAQLKDKKFLQDCYKTENKYFKTDEFYKFFDFYLRNKDNHKIYILETEKGLPVCQAKLDLTNEGWTIKLTLENFAKNLKLEKLFIECVLYKFRLEHNGPIVFSSRKKNNNNNNNNNKLNSNVFSISICSQKTSWINLSIPTLISNWINLGYECIWVHDANDLFAGDICFYLSYEKIVNKEIRKKFKNNLVVHASNLPSGKGWSPMTWEILKGNNNIVITLIEAEDKIDSGVIYLQRSKTFKGHELVDELRSSITNASLHLCNDFVNQYPEILKNGEAQGNNETFYKRRFPEDSRLDVNKSIKEQFGLLRVVDNERYPAFFEIDGYKYYLLIEPNKK